ncbi:MAG: putative glycolipid-binding domain-containing protein [Gemmatimonadetes bacterium]|nr:putative glycolipid-binding domain-containing protein [Gemmatimonadota bacterium]
MVERLARRQFEARPTGSLAAWLAWPFPAATRERHDCVRVVTWRCVDGSGTEVCSLLETVHGPARRGVVAGVLDRKSIGVRYAVQRTPKWKTRQADIRVESGGFTRSCILERDGKGSWRIDGEQIR